MTPDDPRHPSPGDPGPRDRRPPPPVGDDPARPAPGVGGPGRVPRHAGGAHGPESPGPSHNPSGVGGPGRVPRHAGGAHGPLAPHQTYSPGGPDAPGAPPVDGDTLTPDELASALVDGLLPPGAAEAARRRPDVTARVAGIEAARAALRDVPPPDPAARERAVAAALDAFDDPDQIGDARRDAAGSPGRPSSHAGGPAPSGRPPAADLAARRQGRHDRRGRPRWLGAAAAIALLAGVVGLAVAGSGGSDDSEDTALSADVGTTADESAEAGDGGAAGGSSDLDAEDSAEAPSSGAAAADEPLDAGHLGTFATPADLVDELAERVDGRTLEIVPEADAQEGGDAAMAAPLCAADPSVPLGDPGSVAQAHGTAVVDGRDVDVWVVDSPDGPRVIAVGGDCDVLVDQPLT